MADLTAEQVVEALGLVPHHTCGLVAQTYVSPHMIPESALPAGFSGKRSLGAVMYFMVTPEVRTRLHAIRSDQVYHHYMGGPLEVLLLYPDGTGEVRIVGNDLAAGMRPQLFIPGGTVHVSRVRQGHGYALLGTSEWIGVDPADVIAPSTSELAARYPAMAAELASFTAV